MGLFYEAEAIAFRRTVVKESFARVGLWPWNPEKILKACEENSPAAVHPNQKELTNKLASAIGIHRDTRETRRIQILSGLKPVEVIAIQKPEKRKSRRIRDTERLVDDAQQPCVVARRKSKRKRVESPTKHSHILTCGKERCCAKGCQKTRFWSKKWVFCSKCKKNYCPSHAHLLHKHMCK